MIRVVSASRWILLVLVPFVKHGVCVRNPGIDRPCPQSPPLTLTRQANIRLPEITPGAGSHNWRHLCTCVAQSLLKLLKLCNPELLGSAYPASPIPSLGKHEKALGHILSYLIASFSSNFSASPSQKALSHLKSKWVPNCPVQS